MLLEELATGLPDERAENQLAQALRQLPEAEKLAFINCLLDSASTVRSGLRLADRCLESPDSMLTIITAGLDKKNVSILPRWIPLGDAKADTLVAELEQELKAILPPASDTTPE